MLSTDIIFVTQMVTFERSCNGMFLQFASFRTEADGAVGRGYYYYYYYCYYYYYYYYYYIKL